ncbi:MAG TPA: histidine kinase dimerization/phospho-acceptor domain-containing protein [Gemmatimonadales bacterium]|nr:histidine kinase dimerization/phospho-acceptor domain-containing protein [Gemmatimonadales bacterium]HYT82619.1 histidine kinase dimerization/phospho-acceptor domain-containing protein [Gemmatimonadales bacterium]
MAEAADPLRRLRHELSNPLAAVLAETQLLLLDAEKLGDETLASLKRIETLARKMQRILETLDR